MIKWLFNTPPVIGSKWVLGGDPFEDITATVLETKQGWVKYSFKWGGTSTLRIRDFRALYTEVEE